MRVVRTALFLIVASLAGCAADPGPLAGKWRHERPPSTIDFRPGEMRVDSFPAKKVDYDVQADRVLVTDEEGILAGIPIAFAIVDARTIKSGEDVYHRVDAP